MNTVTALVFAGGMAGMLVAIPFFAAKDLAMKPAFNTGRVLQTEQQARDTVYVPLQVDGRQIYPSQDVSVMADEPEDTAVGRTPAATLPVGAFLRGREIAAR